jgi:exodeoxyribonuclease VII large subunit
MIERLRGLSPLDKLSQGYSYTEHEGKTVRSVSDVSSGDGIRVWVRDGVISARVEETEKRKPVNE